MLRILFVSAIHRQSEVENRYPPLWPGYLAAYVEKFLGPGIIEFRYAHYRLGRELKNWKPDIVAISSVTQNFDLACTYARQAKAAGAVVIIGGAHIAAVPGCMPASMDVGCIGEGEQTFLELIRMFLERGNEWRQGLAQVSGLVYHRDSSLVRTPNRPVIENFDEITHPNRALTAYCYRSDRYRAHEAAIVSKLGWHQLSRIDSKLRKRCLFKNIRALRRSPWRNEFVNVMG